MSITKSGLWTSSTFTNFLASNYDSNIYYEPDGTAWIRVVHHNNPTSKLFSSNNTFTTKVFIDDDRWFNMSLANVISSNWEIMIKQKQQSTSTEEKYRWIQSTSPMAGTYEDVAPGTVTKPSSGYNSSSYGGMYLFNSNTYLVCTNGTKGNWFGATGAWNTWNNGIPGYNGVAITTGYYDVYLRVDNIKLTKTSINNGGTMAPQLIEI